MKNKLLHLLQGAVVAGILITTTLLVITGCAGNTASRDLLTGLQTADDSLNLALTTWGQKWQEREAKVTTRAALVPLLTERSNVNVYLVRYQSAERLGIAAWRAGIIASGTNVDMSTYLSLLPDLMAQKTNLLSIINPQ